MISEELDKNNTFDEYIRIIDLVLLSSQQTDTTELEKLFNLDKKSNLEKSKSKSKSESNEHDKYQFDKIKTLRVNFGRFWKLVKVEEQFNYIKLIFPDNFDLAHNLINKIVNYSNHINLVEFAQTFYSIDVSVAKNLIKNNVTNTHVNTHRIKYSNNNELVKLKHNLTMFWIGLNHLRRKIFLSMVDKYYMSEPKPEQIMNDNKDSVDSNLIISDIFDRTKSNVFRAKTLNDIKKIPECLEIDTLVCDGVKFSNNSIDEIPFNIKFLDCKHCDLTNLDWLHDNIKVVDCSSNNIVQLDNLPSFLEVLICTLNPLTKLINLPVGLKFVNCSHCKINLIDKLDKLKQLIYIDCSFNKIINLGSLPPSLSILICNKNKITSFDNLPESLIEFDCSTNELATFPKLPKFIKILKLTQDDLKDEIFHLPYTITKLHLEHKLYENMYVVPNLINEMKITQSALRPKIPIELKDINLLYNSIKLNIPVV